jgi:hypothetical protein
MDHCFSSMRWGIAALALGAVAAGCPSEPRPITVGNGATAEGGAPASERDVDRWPRTYVAGPGSGAALMHDGPAGIARIGYVSQGTPLRIAGFPEQGRVPIRIVDGAMKVKALFDAERFDLRVTRRGKIAGTQVYVTEGDFVTFVEPAEEEGLYRVRAGARFGREGIDLPEYEGVYPADRLGIEPVIPDEPFEPGEPRALPAGMQVPLLESPDGATIVMLPALDPPMVVQLVQQRGEWKAIRVGTGPYLVGYTNADLQPSEALEVAPETRPRAAEGELPMRLRHDEERPLWRVRAGTWVRYGGDRVAQLEAEGWAREMGRSGESGSPQVDVFVAVDDDVAIRGMVSPDALYQPAGQAPAAGDTTPPPAGGTTTPPSGTTGPSMMPTGPSAPTISDQ